MQDIQEDNARDTANMANTVTNEDEGGQYIYIS